MGFGIEKISRLQKTEIVISTNKISKNLETAMLQRFQGFLIFYQIQKT